MTTKHDPYASEEETKALLVPDTRTAAEQKLAAMMAERGADEQGSEAYSILRQIALELLDEGRIEACCCKYATCMKACTPRGKWLAEQPAPVNQGEFERFREGVWKLEAERYKKESEAHKRDADIWHMAYQVERGFKEQEQHPDNAAVDRFTSAMKEKLAQAREKGRSGWETCPPEYLSRLLREHIEKGDPRDVANFSMMLWNLGAGITPQPQQPSPIPWPCEVIQADFDDNTITLQMPNDNFWVSAGVYQLSPPAQPTNKD